MKTEQELKEEFESLGYVEQYRYDLNKNESGNYTSNDTFKLWRGFCLGHLLAQETIAELESRLEQSVDISVVNELNETIEKQKKEIEELQKRSYNYYGLCEQLKLDKKTLEETIKAKDTTIAEARLFLHDLYWLNRHDREAIKTWLESNK